MLEKLGTVLLGDGAETTALISILIGAIKELDSKNTTLEQKVTELKDRVKNLGG